MGGDFVDHWGIKVQTTSGIQYLIHNAGPSDGVVCTPASNMSNKWRVCH